MYVLMVNGSPHKEGNTFIALNEMDRIFRAEGVETEILHIGNQDIRGCIACGSCAKTGKCVFNDAVNEAAPKLARCQGLVVASPVYYASANATLIAFLDRLFFSTRFDKTMIVGASVAAARRGGLTATYGEANEDAEGLQMMRTLARNMVFLMRGIEMAKEKYGVPAREPFTNTDFIR